MFVPSQTAALAAGNQKKAWNYIELFYHEQGDETTSYVTDNYLGGLAKQVAGLNFGQWDSDRGASTLQTQVTSDTRPPPPPDTTAPRRSSSPAPRARLSRSSAPPSYSQIQDAINSASMRIPLRRVMLVLAVIGLGVATYLTIIHYAGLKPACTAGQSCIKVQTSVWSKLDGVPVALLGLIGYIGITASLLAPDREETRLATLGLTLIGFAFSGYLTYRELFSIHAICEWCASSAVILTLLFISAAYRYVTVSDFTAPAAPAPLPPKGRTPPRRPRGPRAAPRRAPERLRTLVTDAGSPLPRCSSIFSQNAGSMAASRPAGARMMQA